MKGLDFEPIKVHQEDESNKKKELSYKGSRSLRKGQKFWEINNKTHEIKEMKMKMAPEKVMKKKSDKWWQGWYPVIDPNKIGRINMAPDCVYIPALNKMNALKHFFRGLGIENPKKLAKEFIKTQNERRKTK